MQVKSLSLVTSFLKTLFDFAGFRIFKASGLLLISSFFQGFSLLMLIPLLGLAGVNNSNNSSDAINSWLQSFLNSFDISYNLISVLGIFLLIIILEAILNRYRTIVLNDLNLNFTNDLRNSLYRHIGEAKWQYHTINHSSQSLHLLDNAVNKIGEGTYYALQIFVYISQVIILLLVASSLSIPMTLIMLFTGIILYALVIPVNKKVFQHGEKAVESNQTLYRNMVDFFSGLKLAKSYNRIDKHIDEFEKIGKKLHTDEQKVIAASSSAQMWLRIFSVSLLCIFVYAGLSIMHLSIDRLLVFIVLVNRLYNIFSSGQNHWHALLQSLPSFDAYNQSINRFKEHKEPRHTQDTLIPALQSQLSMENISFQYEESTDEPTISNISVTFPANKTTAIIGPSGAGKSTMVDLIMGLLTPDSGKMYVDNKELNANDFFNWRKHIAYVPQENFLFDGTIRSNMQWISNEKIDDSDIWTALDAASAESFIHKLPLQLDSVIGERGVKISGGQRQRIALARALLKKPDILILDEATSSLDQKNENRIRDALHKLHGTMTIIIIAHRESTVKDSDFVVLIEQGKVEASGTWDEINYQTTVDDNYLRDISTK